jgi:uncharacterized repeat protein (TIGR03833 family)
VTGGKRTVDGRYRDQLRAGLTVQVVRKQDQGTGRLTCGVVRRLLTRSRFHPHGIKVELEGGVVGRVQHVASPGGSTADGSR